LLYDGPDLRVKSLLL